MDLRSWSFEKDGVVNLKGEWEFYWKSLLITDNYKTYNKQLYGDKLSGYLSFPGQWNGFSLKGKKLSGQGFATYRMKVLLPKTDRMLSIRFDVMGTAYYAYVDGKKVISSGQVGKSRETSKPSLYSANIDFVPVAGETEIIIEISNFHDKSGGPWSPIYLGFTKDILKSQQKARYLEIFLMGSILIMAFYHFFVFFFRRKDISILYFGLFCFLMAFRILLVGERLILWAVPWIPWIVTHKLNYLSIYLSTPVFCLFFHSIFKEDFNETVLKCAVAIGLVLSCFVLLTPPLLFTYTLYIMHLVMLCLGLYIFVIFFYSYRRKRLGTWLVISGFLVLFATIVNDILDANQIISTGNYLMFGFYVFIFSHAILLALRLAKAFETVEEMSGKLVVLDRLKDEFLANTSHELKTPITGIIGIAESMLDGVAGTLSASARGNLAIITASGKRLANLINDILDFSRLKNKDILLKITPADMYQISRAVLTAFYPLAHEKNLELVNLVPEKAPLVAGDENRLTQIMYNLIGNAVKFTEEGSVKVSSKEKENKLLISVTDTGIGIPEDKYESVFQSFEQVSGSTQREFGGTGLGLSITRRLVQLHGGTISVDSKINKGSVFTFSIPLLTEKKQAPAQPQKVSFPYAGANTGKSTGLNGKKNKNESFPDLYRGIKFIQSGKKKTKDLKREKGQAALLIVEDDPVNIQVLFNFLASPDYYCRFARSGSQALNILRDEPPFDLVLLDVMMPRMSGYQVCGKIRETKSLEELPVILMTAKSRTEDIVEGFDAGANDYITKPFSKDELLARIKTQIKIVNQHKELKEKERLKKEMEIAQRIQTAIAPAVPDHNELEITAFTRPAEEVGGDYYDILRDKDNSLWFAIGDVSGHGVTPGLIMMMAQSSFSTLLSENSSLLPGDAINSVNRLLYRNLKVRMKEEHFMTMNFLKYLGEGKFVHAGAHIDILIYRQKNKKVDFLQTEGGYLGMIPDIENFTKNLHFSLAPGDIMLLYTDGLTEARCRESKKLFDLDNLAVSLKESAADDLETIRKNIINRVLSWSGGIQKDDMTLIVVRRKKKNDFDR